MSDEKEQEQEVKVVDRRRFSSDGSSTGRTEEDRPRDSSSVSGSSSKAEQARPDTAEQFAAQSMEDEQAPQVDFPSFVMSLAAQALMMMGEVPNPETGQLMVNLPAARQTVDILDMLGQKTRGNLSKEEEKLLAELLTSLRMAYVNKVKGETVKQP